MSKKIILIYVILISLFTSCKSTSIVGTWMVDENNIIKNNKDLSLVEVSITKKLFNIVTFYNDKTMAFKSEKDKFKWKQNKDKVTIFIPDGKPTQVFVEIINKNRINTYFTLKKGEKIKHYSFYLNKLKNKKQRIVKENEIYMQKKANEKGWRKYYLFKEGISYIIETKSNIEITKELFFEDISKIEDKIGREKCTYTINGNKLFLQNVFSTSTLNIVNEHKLTDENKYTITLIK